jgi:glycine oxidase
VSMGGSDVVVLGAGIVGLSAARALAARGADVLLIEATGVAAEASGAAAGMLAPQAEADAGSPLLELGLRALEYHVRLAAALREETGLDVDLGRPGLLEVAFDDAGAEALEVRRRWQTARGLAVSALSADELRQAEPNLGDAVVAGLFVPGDRWVDNVRLARALAASATARGVRLLCGRPATSLRHDGGRVRGVVAGGEIVDAPVVINALGAWAGLLGGDPAPPPVEPVRGHIVAFDVQPLAFHHVIFSHRGYLVPRSDGRLLAGSTMERAGFDKSVTAAGLRTVLDIALEISPRLADMRVADSWAGLRPGTPDGLPIVGAGGVAGLYHAAGLYRNGILLGPLVGELVAEVAAGAPARSELAPFTPARFGAVHAPQDAR